MKITADYKDGVLLAMVEGRIDGSNAASFSDKMRELVGDQVKPVVLDFSQLTYVSSAGLRVVLILAKSQWAKKTTFAICGMQETILEVFTLSGMNRLITLCDTVEEAVAHTKG